MNHSLGFLKLAADAKSRVHEITLEEAQTRLAHNPKAVLLDVREDHEWLAGHAAEAVHLGKGIFERDLENKFPDPKHELIMYCDVAQKMGYWNVHSVVGGYKAMMDAGWPVKNGA
jgi:rhodanese-related sulfurtransferase